MSGTQCVNIHSYFCNALSTGNAEVMKIHVWHGAHRPQPLLPPPCTNVWGAISMLGASGSCLPDVCFCGQLSSTSLFLTAAPAGHHHTRQDFAQMVSSNNCYWASTEASTHKLSANENMAQVGSALTLQLGAECMVVHALQHPGLVQNHTSESQLPEV